MVPPTPATGTFKTALNNAPNNTKTPTPETKPFLSIAKTSHLTSKNVTTQTTFKPPADSFQQAAIVSTMHFIIKP
jgi:hypothetical protein